MATREIKVRDGQVWVTALVDEEDYDALSTIKWCIHKPKKSATMYAKCVGAKETRYMHRLVAQPSAKQDVDHIDGNGLNNTRENLRCVSRAVNIKSSYSRRAYDAWKAGREAQKRNESVKTAVNQSGEE